MEFKFLSGGKPFFGLVNGKNLNKLRFDATQQVYRELERGLDEDKLNGFLDTVIALAATKDAEKMLDIHFISRTIRTRNNVANYAYLGFKMAACYYVGQDEDFDSFDWELARKKVNYWREHETDIQDFFLRSQVLPILPFSDYLNKSIRDFSQLDRKVDNNQLAIMLTMLTNLKENSASSQSQTLQNAIDLLTSRQWPTESTEAINTP